jgi:hypothetical protein
MPTVFEIPCESEQEAKDTARDINNVGKGVVKAEVIQKNGKWFVHVTEKTASRGAARRARSG